MLRCIIINKFLQVLHGGIIDAFENVGYVDLLQTRTHISQNENFPSGCFIIYGRFSESVIVAPPHRPYQRLDGIYHPQPRTNQLQI